MMDALLVVQRLAETVHGGTLAVFAFLLLARGALPQHAPEDLGRTWRAAGATLGITLGLVVLCFAVRWGSALHPALGFPDRFGLPDAAAPGSGLATARLALLVPYWVSYVVLEIWTNEPLRLLDREGVSEASAYEAGLGRVRAHLALNAALFLAFVGVGALAPV